MAHHLFIFSFEILPDVQAPPSPTNTAGLWKHCVPRGFRLSPAAQLEDVCDIVVTPNGGLSELHVHIKKRGIKRNVNNKR